MMVASSSPSRTGSPGQRRGARDDVVPVRVARRRRQRHRDARQRRPGRRASCRPSRRACRRTAASTRCARGSAGSCRRPASGTAAPTRRRAIQIAQSAISHHAVFFDSSATRSPGCDALALQVRCHAPRLVDHLAPGEFAHARRRPSAGSAPRGPAPCVPSGTGVAAPACRAKLGWRSWWASWFADSKPRQACGASSVACRPVRWLGAFLARGAGHPLKSGVRAAPGWPLRSSGGDCARRDQRPWAMACASWSCTRRAARSSPCVSTSHCGAMRTTRSSSASSSSPTIDAATTDSARIERRLCGLRHVEV